VNGIVSFGRLCFSAIKENWLAKQPDFFINEAPLLIGLIGLGNVSTLLDVINITDKPYL